MALHGYVGIDMDPSHTHAPVPSIHQHQSHTTVINQPSSNQSDNNQRAATSIIIITQSTPTASGNEHPTLTLSVLDCHCCDGCSCSWRLRLSERLMSCCRSGSRASERVQRKKESGRGSATGRERENRKRRREPSIMTPKH